MTFLTDVVVVVQQKWQQRGMNENLAIKTTRRFHLQGRKYPNPRNQSKNSAPARASRAILLLLQGTRETLLSVIKKFPTSSHRFAHLSQGVPVQRRARINEISCQNEMKKVKYEFLIPSLASRKTNKTKYEPISKQILAFLSPMKLYEKESSMLRYYMSITHNSSL